MQRLLQSLSFIQLLNKIGPFLVLLSLLLSSSYSQAQALFCEQVVFPNYKQNEVLLFNDYPLLKKKFDTTWALNSKIELNPQVTHFTKIKFTLRHNTNPYNKLRSQREEIQNTFVAIYNRMNDSKAFARYVQDLLIDTAQFMKDRGREEDLQLLEQGRVTRAAALKVLILRMKKRNIEVTALRTEIDRKDFQKHVQSMAFIDYPFYGNRHGRDTHLLQVDFVYDVVFKNMNGKPLEFYQFLGSSKGIWFWTDLFDAQFELDFRSPEFFSPRVRSTIPML